MLTHVHPGVAPEQVQDATGCELRIADDVAVGEPPSEGELAALRALRTKGPVE